MLALYWLIAVGGVRDKSVTFDEIAFVTGGYSYWALDDYRLSPEGGILPQRWAAWPLTFGHYRFPSPDQPAWRTSDAWEIGHQFFYELGNDSRSMLLMARSMIAVLGMGLGLLVYFWSRHLFGPAGGMISAVLFAFCPSLLANGALVTADLAFTLCLTLSAWCLWNLVHDVTPKTVLGSSLAMSALFLSKVSAILIIPMGVIMFCVRLISKKPPQKHHLFKLAAAGVVHIAVVAVVIWASYGFRYSAYQDAQAGRDQMKEGRWEVLLKNSGVTGPVVDFARRHQLLPESYLYGFEYALKYTGNRRAFLNGRYSAEGWLYFFPYTFLVKTPLSFFVLLALGFFAVIKKGKQSLPDLYPTAPLWILLIVYWDFALTSSLNIGHRHILPVYPALIILAGACAFWFKTEYRIARAAVVLSLFTFAVESLSVYPNYLAYFNSLAGGPRNGYRRMVDSSLDWGQDLPGLKRWLDARGLNEPSGAPVYLSYFGMGDPGYEGIRVRRMVSYPDAWRKKTNEPLRGGVYCVSATLVQSVYNNFWGPWALPYEQTYQELLRRSQSFDPATLDRDPDFISFEDLRFARLCAFLRHREPDEEVGGSILIYRLTDEEVDRALRGPPAELSAEIQISG